MFPEKHTKLPQWVITVKGDDEDATTRQRKQSYQDTHTDIHAFAAVLSEQITVFPEKVLHIEMALHVKD